MQRENKTPDSQFNPSLTLTDILLSPKHLSRFHSFFQEASYFERTKQLQLLFLL